MLDDISWYREGIVNHLLLPAEITGIETPLAVICGWHFPTGSHKVGPAYAMVLESELRHEITPGQTRLVWPSTGNFGIGGAWIAKTLGYEAIVVLPAGMSSERYQMIDAQGATIIRTPGSESNVREIYERVIAMQDEPDLCVMNQFSDWANYRFHTTVTAPAILDLAERLGAGGVGQGYPTIFVSAMGSAGTIAAGDVLKERCGTAVVAVEPVQCPTLSNLGFGEHRIEGIGDKHVTWIHNVHSIDLLICIDDEDCLKVLELFATDSADATLELGIGSETLEQLRGHFGPSGVCNILASIKAAKALGLSRRDLIVTVATDGADRYHSVLEARRSTNRSDVRITLIDAALRLRDPRLDHVLEGTPSRRKRWHNQKYFTWVEQLGKTVEELRALESPEWWAEQRSAAEDIHHKLSSDDWRSHDRHES